MLLLNAFMTQRQLLARGRPVRAPSRLLNGVARTGLGLAYAAELALVFCGGGAHDTRVLVASVVGLVACHVIAYAIESSPACLKEKRAPTAA